MPCRSNAKLLAFLIAAVTLSLPCPTHASVTGLNTDPSSSAPLYIGTQGNYYMTILTDGNVGIGITSPSYPLEVYSTTTQPLEVIGPLGGTAASFTDTKNGTLNIRFPAFNQTDLFGNSTNLTFSDQSGTVMGIYGSNVGIGVTNPSLELDIEKAGDTAMRVYDTTSGRVVSLTTNQGGNAPAVTWGGSRQWELIDEDTYMLFYDGTDNTYPIEIYSNGNVTIGGAVTAVAYYHSSDARLKTDVRPITHALDKVLALKGVEFNWKKDGRPDMGVTAQNVKTVFPNIVSHGPDGMMSVEYDSMVGPMIEAFRELKAEDDNLRAAHEVDEKAIDELRRKIAALKKEAHVQ